MGTSDGSIIATIITTHMPTNVSAASDHVCPGMRIHAIDIVQPPGIGIPPMADIDEHHTNDHVQIGSTVKVSGPDGSQSFTIVGSTEAKPTEGRISNESPVGGALLGKKKGENVLVQVPAGKLANKIVSIT